MTVEASFLSETKLTCRSPKGFVPERLPYSVPFSIAFNKDDLEPWTQSPHRFRFYDQPITERSLPSESEVGVMTEVYVHSEDGTKFMEPVPVEGMPYDDYGLSCQFGRFGKTPGTLLNSTTVKCITPQLEEHPEELYRETIDLVVAQNGQNYNEFESETKYTFVGTKTESSFWPWIIALILIFLALIAIVFCLALYITKQSQLQTSTHAYQPENAPYVLNQKPRGYMSQQDEQYNNNPAELREEVRREELRGKDNFDPGTNPYEQREDPYY